MSDRDQNDERAGRLRARTASIGMIGKFPQVDLPPIPMRTLAWHGQGGQLNGHDALATPAFCHANSQGGKQSGVGRRAIRTVVFHGAQRQFVVPRSVGQVANLPLASGIAPSSGRSAYRARGRFRRRAVTSSGLGGSDGIRLVARSSAVTRFAWFMVWSLSFSVLFLVDLHCGHCRVPLLPFGTVGNGRFCPAGRRLFSAKLAKQRAIPLPRTVRARQFFLAAAARAVTAERSEEASSPALRPRFFAAPGMTGLARIPCRDQLLYRSRLRMVRFRDVLTLARSASEERCCASLARASG